MSFKLDFASDIEIRRHINLANLANKSKSHDLAGVWLRRRWREEKSAGRRRRRPQKRANYSTWETLVNKDNVLICFSTSWIHCWQKHICYGEQARTPDQKGLIFRWNHKLGVGVAEGPSRYGKSRSSCSFWEPFHKQRELWKVQLLRRKLHCKENLYFFIV